MKPCESHSVYDVLCVCVCVCARAIWCVCVCVCVTAWVAVSDAQHAKSVSLASWPGWRSSI